jgi:2-keto-4-pentenoate hydratase/2-oxohepta-3-ene-1,7-dioic acid hydratase in catechol pathway
VALVACYSRRSAAETRIGLVDLKAGTVFDLGPATADGILPVVSGEVDVAIEPKARRAGSPIEEVLFRAPLPRPRRNIFCVGKNFRDHALELPTSSGLGSGAVPAQPVVFTKPPSAVIGDGDPIDAHRGITEQLDYEAELAVIVGRGGRRIPAERALEHVWGYTVVNDVTARDLQAAHQQWFLGKGLDTFCPMGPWAVTADSLDLDRAVVSCRVNGELRQHAPVTDLIFDIATLVEVISAGITLEPGDVIATGTPAGVGAGFDPPRFLQPGEVVEVSVTGIGTVTNQVVG